MTNMERVVRLLSELDQLDRDDAPEGASSDRVVTSSALVHALVAQGYSLTAAIVSTGNGD